MLTLEGKSLPSELPHNDVQYALRIKIWIDAWASPIIVKQWYIGVVQVIAGRIYDHGCSRSVRIWRDRLGGSAGKM